MLLPTLLGFGALSAHASPVQHTTTGQLLVQHPTSPTPPACASFHGRLPIRPHTSLYYASADCTASSGARGLPLEWTEGRLLWTADSELDATVDALVTRRDELNAMRTMQQTDQQTLGSGSQGWRVVLDLGEGRGELIQVENDEMLRSFTQSEEWSLREMVAISEDPLPAPAVVVNSLGTANDSAGVPSRDVKRVQDHLDSLKFSPLVCGLKLCAFDALTLYAVQISTLLGTFRQKQLIADVRYLSNEDQSLAQSDDERWVSRHSMSEGSVKASAWLLRESARLRRSSRRAFS